MAIWLFFLCLPILEIAVFIAVGEEIGILSTILLCFLMAIIGIALVRVQGVYTLLKGQETLRRGIMPTQEIFDGFCLLAAGALLVLPGFVSDGVAIALLIPPARRLLQTWLIARGAVTVHAPSAAAPRGDDIIEGDFERVDPDDRSPPGRLH